MGVRHTRYPIEGVQFHPESILSQEGDRIIRNFLDGTGGGIMMFKETLTKLTARQDLTPAEAAGMMRMIMEGKATQAQIGAFLLALHMKGETAEEIAAFARVMRDHAITVQTGDRADAGRHLRYRRRWCTDIQHQHRFGLCCCRSRLPGGQTRQPGREQQVWFGRCPRSTGS